MRASLVTAVKDVDANGNIIEMIIWHLPEPVAPATHLYRYRLAYIVDGARVIGFDNERGKGDHRHVDGEEHPYVFSSVAQLIEDFIAEVERRRRA